MCEMGGGRVGTERKKERENLILSNLQIRELRLQKAKSFGLESMFRK